MNSIELKNDKETKFTAKMISLLIEAGAFWNEKKGYFYLYTILQKPEKCLSFLADTQWAMFSSEAQKEFVNALNAKKDHCFLRFNSVVNLDEKDGQFAGKLP